MKNSKNQSTIYIVRHGHMVWDEKGINQGSDVAIEEAIGITTTK